MSVLKLIILCWKILIDYFSTISKHLKYYIFSKFPVNSNPRFTVLLGGNQKCTVNRGHGKSGEVNTCSIVKHDIGEHKEACYIEGRGKSGPSKSEDYCIIIGDIIVSTRSVAGAGHNLPLIGHILTNW